MKLFRNLKADKLTKQLITLREHDTDAAKKAISALEAVGDSAVPKVVDALALADKRQMVTFVELLGRLLTEKNADAYFESLTSDSGRAVAGVAWALSTSRNYNPNRLVDLLEREDISKAKLFEIIEAQKKNIDARRLLRHAYELGPAEKEQCMRIIDNLADETLLPELITRVDGKDPLIRSHIITTLGRFGGTEVQHVVQKQLRDRSKLVRQAALSSLAKMGKGLDIELMCSLLSDKDIEVQNKAVDVLIKLAHPDTPRYLIEALQDENEYARRAAVEVLNEVANTDSIKDLLNALQDSDWWVRSRATDALAKIGGDRVVDAVLELINDDDEHIRRSAIEILNSTRSERAISYLMDATKDPDWWVRERAVDALADMGATEALPAMLAMLQGHPKSIPAAIRGIAVLGDSKVIPDLVAALEYREKEIKIEAAAALSKLATERHAPEIAGALAQQDPNDGSQIALALSRARKDIDARFSATVIEENKLAEKMAQPQKTLLIDDAPKKIAEAALEEITLDLATLEPGQLIDDRYKFIQPIGKGAFGTVILVEDSIVQERLVLKFLNKNISSDEEMMQRFVHELRYSRKITHRNVIRIYDFLKLGGLYAISMEYFPSHTLRGEIKDDQPLPPLHAVAIGRDIAMGMAVAHQVGIVHRDLKPANVLINNDGLVKVVDFGVASAHSSGDTQLTKTGYVIGSPKYMAPEQILGKKVDQRADIYSLGIIMYELLNGTPPYTKGDHMSVMYQHVQGGATPLHEANPSVPMPIVEIVNKALAIDKMERYQSMDDLRIELEGQLEAT
ncbi:MAG: HEAT repeat domain-containing protein [Gammaproteobacteria bacterium]